MAVPVHGYSVYKIVKVHGFCIVYTVQAPYLGCNGKLSDLRRFCHVKPLGGCVVSGGDIEIVGRAVKK